MVVDLERNDLGRVCVPGSVEVSPLYEVVETPYCHQLVSTVRGIMRPDASLGDLLESAFPCGSVTGAPKVAAMRIARELEASPRAGYCGALVVAMPGRLDSSVLIRTLEYRADGSAAWGTGCGITIDSDPDGRVARKRAQGIAGARRGPPPASRKSPIVPRRRSAESQKTAVCALYSALGRNVRRGSRKART